MGGRLERARSAARTAGLNDRYLSSGDVARLLECSIREVGRMVESGVLSAVLDAGCYRFPPAEVRRFIATGGAAPSAPDLELLPACEEKPITFDDLVAVALAKSGEPLWP